MRAYARFASGDRQRGSAEVSRVLRNAVANAVAAEAHFRLGAMAETQLKMRVTSAATPVLTPQAPPLTGPQPSTRSNGPEPTVRRSAVVDNSKALKAAIESYRKAYDLAAPGSGTLEGATRALARIDDRPLPPKQGMLSTLRLIVPPRPALTGETEFVAEAGPGVARVDFFLDDQQVASQKKAPFRASIDVGPTARARSVKARAFDAQGKPLGDAVVTINDRLDAFVLTIVAPVTDVLRGDSDVELDVRVPPGRALKN